MINEVEKLRILANQHRDAARALDKAADVIEQMGSTLNGEPIYEPVKPKRAHVSNKERRKQMRELVLENGPMKRREFVAHGIPNGTAGYLLSEEGTDFVKVAGSRWGLREIEEGGIVRDEDVPPEE